MAIELVDLPIKRCDFHIVMLVYQRVFETTNQHVMSRFAGVFGHDLALTESGVLIGGPDYFSTK